MGKSSVYSWRMEPERKAQLEDIARRRKRPLADLVDEAVTQWLRRQKLESEDEEARVRRAAMRTFGTISADPDLATEARDRLREKLRAKRR